MVKMDLYHAIELNAYLTMRKKKLEYMLKYLEEHSNSSPALQADIVANKQELGEIEEEMYWFGTGVEIT